MLTETAVKERPILFSAPMVRAILDGRKTQTRRVMKPQPEVNPHSSQLTWRWHPPSARRDSRYDLWMPSSQWLDGVDPTQCGAAAIVEFGPHGVPGDRLWVRESWGIASTACGGEETVYAADYPDDSDKAAGVVRRPSIHMRRDQSRITLEITDIRVQRLQEISEADAAAEGVRPLPLQSADDPSAWWETEPGENQSRSAGESFRKLWHTIHPADGPNGWYANPWLWCITFRRVV